MKLNKIKFIQVFSNGSVIFNSNTCCSLKQFQIFEADYKNFFFFKKKKVKNIKKFVSLSNYKNQYLF